ncbi:MAG: amino acid adenylation domain-containing protein [Cyanobacteria bacterium P01_D01_bin.156]
MSNSLSSTSALRDRISSLSPAQRKLLRQQLEAKGISWDKVAGTCSTDAERPERLPLSPSQRHLWVIHQLYPETSAYNIAITLRLTGELNIQALTQSLQAVVQRHESLRTVFVQQDDHPYQRILSKLSIQIPFKDLRHVSNPSDTVDKRQKQLAHQPFDLELGPLIRAQLLQLENDQFEFILVLHHLVGDGWSRGVLLQELAAFYRGYCTKRPTNLPVLQIQYADHVLRQQSQSQKHYYQKHLAYWKHQLANLLPLDLPGRTSTAPSTQNPDFASRTLTCTFSREQTQLIKQLSQQSGATLFMVLLAIFKLLLHRYSGQQDLAVGVPVAGRNTADVEPLIGFFVNTLVLRTQLKDQPAFRDWLKQVQGTVADALQHQDIPFAEVVDALDVERIPGQNPLFQVMFQVQSGYQLQNAEHLAVDMPGVSIEQGWIELNQTKFDMSWHVIERDESLLVAVEYRTAIFECDRIQTMLSHFQTLTTAVLANPDASVAELFILSPQERRQLIEWGQGKVVVEPSRRFFPQRFEEQVEKTPDSVAIQVDSPNCGLQTLTYQHLNQRANQLAHWLEDQGVGPESLVGVCLSHGVDLMVALLGTLKAGGAYIPLDPSLPRTRLQYMVDDANPRVLLTQSQHLSRLLTEDNPADIRSKVVLLFDKDEQVLTEQSVIDPKIKITPENLAYVIYTSGSTGQPKGTLLTHRGLINYLDWCVAAYPLSEGKGVPIPSSIGFDATITSLFSPLLVGQSLIFNTDISEIEAIQSALSAGVSLIKLTPAHLRALQPILSGQSLDKDSLPKALVIGGEALHDHHVSLWREQYPEVTLINEYGPTEAVVGCCVHWVSHDDQGSLPIGRPIDGVQFYVLDQYLEPVPVGIPGELYIGGSGVARGYLNRPDLTAEKFIQNPFVEEQENRREPPSTLYKTGDLAYYTQTGTLHYLGRIDNQIKVRGFRIEPGEIEALLCQHAQVDQAVVLLNQDHDRERLVAYIVFSHKDSSDDSSSQLIAELRTHAAQVLPAYMMPTQFVELEQLPLTSNGKVDRTALPKPSIKQFIQAKGSPQTEKEEVLLDIWQQILGSQSVGVHDNFFELGGDSISAMQIVAKAQQKGLSLTPTQLFEHQTVATQAAVATQKTSSIPQTSVVGKAPLGPIQWDFFEQELPVPNHYNQSVMVVVKPETNIEHLKTGLQLLVDHHDALRLRFRKDSEQSNWQQYYQPAGTVEVPVKCLEVADERQLTEAVEKLQASLDLTTGPLFRAALLRLQTGDSRLLLVAHHLIVDGVSWRILLADLLDIYGQLEAQQMPMLPQKSTAFGDWARHVQQQSFAAESAHWLDMCKAVPPLPVDDSEVANIVKHQTQISVSLDEQQTARLKALKLPVDLLLTTALAQTIYQWSRNQTLVIDTEDHGRHSWNDDIELSRTVGWFTALFPIRLSLPLGSLDEQLTYVQQTLGQVPNHGVGYGALRAAQQLHLKSPAQISFNYLGRLDLSNSGGFIQGLAPETVTAVRHGDNACRYLMEVIAFVQSDAAADTLKVTWRYGQGCYRRRTVEQLSQRYLTNLKSLISHCDSSANVQQAPSRASRVDSQQLSQLMSKLAARGRT